MQLKRALVTGGGGFVGKAIIKKLLVAGLEARVIGRSRYSELEKLGVRCWQGDIVDGSMLREAIRGVDVVFHTAALAGIWGPWQEYYHTNVLGTESVLQACRAESVPFLVYTSTPSVVFNSRDIYGGDEELAYGRKVLCNYAKSKIIAEKLVLAANSAELATCALRPHLIWGPGDPHLLPRIVASARRGELKMVGDGTNLVDISYVDNVADAHVLAAKCLARDGKAGGRAYFISQGQPVNLWEWLNNLLGQLGIARIDAAVSFGSAYAVGGVLELLYSVLKLRKEPKMTRFLAEQLAKSHYFSIACAQNDLGYTPAVSTEDGLQLTINWLKTL